MTGVIHNRLHASIHVEHLEEAAILYEHRQRWLEDPSLTFHDLAELEERQEAHLDALVIGAPQTLELCDRAVAEGGAAELHVGLRIACRCGQIGVFDALEMRLSALDEDERSEFEEAASAASSAELPTDWPPMLSNVIEGSICGAIVAEAIGRRRIPAGPLLLRIVIEQGSKVDPRYVRALGELRYQAALPHLRALLGHATTPKLWSEVAIACLMLGDPEVAALVAGSAQISAWSPIGQAIVFDVPSAWLCARLDDQPTWETLAALALRGDPGSLIACVERLADDDLGDAAAAALMTITGAPLFEAGPVPIRCRDPERWSAWLHQHAREWSPGARYRLGHPHTPAIARASVVSFALPLELRAAIRDELAIRHGEIVAHVTASAREQLSGGPRR